MSEKRMPVLFVGHGSPMNAIENNEFSRGWHEVGKSLPKPKAILCISAHWETWGTLVTSMEKPKTIHDFGGFPRELYTARYPAPGSPWLADEVKKLVHTVEVGLDEDWGLDHGCWSVLKQMYPAADIPVVQLSLDYTRQGKYHLILAKELAPLREQGVLIIGSGNMVHNLRLVEIPGGDFGNFNQPFAFEWAKEADAIFKKLINAGNYEKLADYHSLGDYVQLAVPTPEHFFPMLYALSLKTKEETITYFNDKPLAGSLTMTSLLIQ
jgi:4,5-DOPA dioxygenase extradiol